ncbi:hypothetical protein CYMTET_51122, partial [Cymbomonas tetramitiformis]
PPTITFTGTNDNAEALKIHWTGTSSTTCVTINGVSADISTLSMFSASVPIGSSVLSWVFNNADMCVEGVCAFTLCDFSLGTTMINGTAHYTEASGLSASNINTTVIVVQPPPPPNPPRIPLLPSPPPESPALH